MRRRGGPQGGRRKKQLGLPGGDAPQPGYDPHGGDACGACGAMMQVGASFCHVCGSSIGAAGGAPGPAPRSGIVKSQGRGDRSRSASAGNEVGAAVVVMWLVAIVNLAVGAWTGWRAWNLRKGLRAAMNSGEELDPAAVEVVDNLATLASVVGFIYILMGMVFIILAVRAKRAPVPCTLAAALIQTVALGIGVLIPLSLDLVIEVKQLLIPGAIVIVLWIGYAGARTQERTQRRLRMRQSKDEGRPLGRSGRGRGRAAF